MVGAMRFIYTKFMTNAKSLRVSPEAFACVPPRSVAAVARD